MMHKIADLCSKIPIRTVTWNPIMYAIFYGQLPIVQYVLRLADEGIISLHYLICDAFKVMRDESDEDSVADEEILLNQRSSMIALVISLMTGNQQMLSLLWNYPHFYT